MSTSNKIIFKTGHSKHIYKCNFKTFAYLILKEAPYFLKFVLTWEGEGKLCKRLKECLSMKASMDLEGT